MSTSSRNTRGPHPPHVPLPTTLRTCEGCPYPSRSLPGAELCEPLRRYRQPAEDSADTVYVLRRIRRRAELLGFNCDHAQCAVRISKSVGRLRAAPCRSGGTGESLAAWGSTGAIVGDARLH